MSITALMDCRCSEAMRRLRKQPVVVSRTYNVPDYYKDISLDYQLNDYGYSYPLTLRKITRTRVGPHELELTADVAGDEPPVSIMVCTRESK